MKRYTYVVVIDILGIHHVREAKGTGPGQAYQEALEEIGGDYSKYAKLVRAYGPYEEVK